MALPPIVGSGQLSQACAVNAVAMYGQRERRQGETGKKKPAGRNLAGKGDSDDRSIDPLRGVPGPTPPGERKEWLDDAARRVDDARPALPVPLVCAPASSSFAVRNRSACAPCCRRARTFESRGRTYPSSTSCHASMLPAQHKASHVPHSEKCAVAATKTRRLPHDKHNARDCCSVDAESEFRESVAHPDALHDNGIKRLITCAKICRCGTTTETCEVSGCTPQGCASHRPTAAQPDSRASKRAGSRLRATTLR